MAHLIENSYGKSEVRLTKVVRTGAQGDVHTLLEFSISILLEGSFDRVYTHGENGSCIPTDTMKNTVYALARQHSFDSPEPFARILAAQFLEAFTQVTAADVGIHQVLWDRIQVAGSAHAHAFAKGSNALRKAGVRRERSGTQRLTGGITGLDVVKTTKSGFEGFLRDQYTTLKETGDRIFGTSVDAVWTYGDAGADFNAVFETARRVLLEVFSTHDSRAVQQTLFAMGQAVLDEVPAISTISITMPNQHRLLVNLEPFGMTNPNEIFVTTSEPFGVIKGTMTRD